MALPLCASIPMDDLDALAAQNQNACPVGLSERYTAPAAGNTYNDDDGALEQAGDLTLTRDPATGFLTATALGNVTDARTFNAFGEVSSYAAAVTALKSVKGKHWGDFVDRQGDYGCELN
jgi:hypothetical protein